MRHIHTISFKHAFDGLRVAASTQPNFRVHMLATIIVILAGYYYQISTTEWLLLTLTIGSVLVAELFNTAIESVVDLLTQQHNHFAKNAKDVAAAAVLMSAFISIIVGIVIFLPKIL